MGRKIIKIVPSHGGTVGNQADMTSSSVFQRLNSGMSISTVRLSYPKTEFAEINTNVEKAHSHGTVDKSVILRRTLLLSTYTSVSK
jgi:hypothetical protein